MLFKSRELGIPIHGNLQTNVALVVGQPNIYRVPTYVPGAGNVRGNKRNQTKPNKKSRAHGASI